MGTIGDTLPGASDCLGTIKPSGLEFYVANNDIQSANTIRLYGCFLRVSAKLFSITTKINPGTRRVKLHMARIADINKYANGRGIYIPRYR